MSLRSIPLLLAAALSACIIDPSSNPAAEACVGDADCAAGTCHRGFCVVHTSGDAGVPLCEGASIGQRFDCYDGPAGTLGVGICRPGEVACLPDVMTPCLGQVLPGIEICDGKDNDCNGSIDDFPEASCERVGQLGVCARGTLVCRDEAAQCVALLEPSAEVCDGEDNDCNGETDENADESCFPAGTEGCTATEDGFECLGVCKPGIRRCVDGQLGACMGAVVPADSDGCTPQGELARDDDCDGVVDQDCACVLDATQDCYNGPEGTMGVGTCRPGTQVCEETATGNRFGACTQQILPMPETCANPGADNDCDGIVDNVPGLGQPCEDPSAQGICRSGVRACVGGSLVCNTPSARPEVCNGLDDDCDGIVDNGFLLGSDPNHCGACGNVCGQGESCCSGTCVRLASSPSHCGECGNACGSGLGCCSGACFDLQTDRANCGTCGRTCANNETCRAGRCCRGQQCS